MGSRFTSSSSWSASKGLIGSENEQLWCNDLEVCKKEGEKDKEYGQLEDILRLIKIAQRGTEWVELITSEHVIPKAFNSFFKSDF